MTPPLPSAPTCNPTYERWFLDFARADFGVSAPPRILTVSYDLRDLGESNGHLSSANCCRCSEAACSATVKVETGAPSQHCVGEFGPAAGAPAPLPPARIRP
jgi:hypothetical protein